MRSHNLLLIFTFFKLCDGGCPEPIQGSLTIGFNVPGWVPQRTSGPVECALLCGKNEQCRGWTQHVSTNFCHLKISLDHKNEDPEWIHGPPCKEVSTSGETTNLPSTVEARTLSSDGNQTESSTSGQGGIALGVGVAVSLLLLLVAVISGTLMCTKAQKRQKRNETLKLESNPVYATYEIDADPIAEVEDVNVYYGEVYEGEERPRHTDNNPLYA